jgi:hypothetical protein
MEIELASLIDAITLLARFIPNSLVRIAYRSPTAARWMTAWLQKAIAPREGVQFVTIVTGPLARFPFIVDLPRQKYFWFGTFEPWVQEALIRHFRPGTCCAQCRPADEYDAAQAIGGNSMIAWAFLNFFQHRMQ